MRAVQSSQTAEAWKNDIERHRRMIDLLREGDPFAAEFVVRATMQQFATRAYAVWQKRDASGFLTQLASKASRSCSR
jgi:DNA-binding GntR family transcriptional regulator